MSTMPYLPNDRADSLRTVQPSPRNETQVDAIATLVQIGHRDGKTSFDVAGEIWEMVCKGVAS